MTPLESVIFARIAVEESKRTVVCNPEHESVLKTFVRANALEGIITVEPNPNCPVGHFYFLDLNAIEAGARQALTGR